MTTATSAGLEDAKTLDAELLRHTIALCHPDRHPPERAEQANRVTRELLPVRGNGAAK